MDEPATLTSPQAVRDAIAECDRLGRSAFLSKYGFGQAQSFFLVQDGRRYDSKAIAGAAHGYQYPRLGPLATADFSGGEKTVARRLRELGFVIERVRSAPKPLPAIEVGREYQWDALGALFGFKPAYLGAAGGMVPRPDYDALLLITHPRGGKSFDYEDYWDGADLIYTGRGQVGDQSLDGPNGDVAQNRRALLVFEHVGSRALRYLGQAQCTGHWPARGTGDDGNERLIYRFRLHFGVGLRASVPAPATAVKEPKQPAHRQPRPFDPAREMSAFQAKGQRTSHEETLVLQEKNARGHQRILVTLHRFLTSGAWSAIEEVPAAVDLWAISPEGRRVIFEAKTLGDANEVHQCRAGLAQQLEYRFFLGTPEDELCLVVDQPVSDARLRFMDAAGVGVALAADGLVTALGARAVKTLGGRWPTSPPTGSPVPTRGI